MKFAKYILLFALGPCIGFADLQTQRNLQEENTHHWSLKPFGTFAAKILRTIVRGENSIHNSGFLSEDVFKAVYFMVDDIISNQNKVQASLIIGCILTILSTFTVVLLYFWSLRIEPKLRVNRLNKKQKSILSAKLSTVKLISLTLGIFVSVSVVVMGSVFVLSGANRLNGSNVQIFSLLQFALNGTYMIKNALVKTVQKIPEEMDRVTHINLGKMLSIKQQVMAKFVTSTKGITNPLIENAMTIDGNFRDLLRMSFNDSYAWESLSNKSKYLENSTSVFLSYNTIGTNSSTVETIMEPLKYKIVLRIRNISDNIEFLLNSLQYDILFLKAQFDYSYTNLAFTSSWALIDLPLYFGIDWRYATNNLNAISRQAIDKKIAQVRNFTQFLEWLLPSNTQDIIYRKLVKNSDQINTLFERIYPIFPTIAIVAMSIVFPIIMGVIIGLVGTNCFARCGSDGYSRNLLSNSGGNILESGLYTVSFFLWIFFSLSVMLFVVSIASTSICESFESKSVTDIPVNFLSENKNDSSNYTVSNIILRDILRTCEANGSLIEVFNAQDIFKIKVSDFNVSRVKFSAGMETLDSLLLRIPLINVSMLNNTSSMEVSKLQYSIIHRIKILDQVSDDLLSVRNGIQWIKKKLKNPLWYRNDSLSTFKYSREAKSFYDALSGFVVQMLKEVQSKTIEYKTVSLRLVKHLKNNLRSLAENSEYFNHFIKYHAKYTLLRDIESVENMTITGLLSALEYAIATAEDIGCLSLWSMYNRVSFYTCENGLEAYAIVWLGACLIPVFLLITILLSIPVAGLFKLPCKRRKLLNAVRSTDRLRRGYDLTNRRRATFNAVMASSAQYG